MRSGHGFGSGGVGGSFGSPAPSTVTYVSRLTPGGGGGGGGGGKGCGGGGGGGGGVNNGAASAVPPGSSGSTCTLKSKKHHQQHQQQQHVSAFASSSSLLSSTPQYSGFSVIETAESRARVQQEKLASLTAENHRLRDVANTHSLEVGWCVQA